MSTQTIASESQSATQPWYKEVTGTQWRTLLAAKFGWMLDAFDFLLYVMAIGQLKTYFGFNDATAGLLGTITLLTSASGGLLFGLIADRFGRTRALMGTVLIFSFCSLGAATSSTLLQLMIWRAVLGIGMGGEWASGAVLVNETWPAHLRTRAVSIMQSGWALGYILAAIVASAVLSSETLGANAWRWLFAIGVLPALFVLWVRRSVPEPEAWTRAQQVKGPRRNPFAVLFSSELRKRTILAILLATVVQFGYWGLFFWLPSFLARPLEQGGAGLSIVRSMAFIIPMQIGAYLGYLSFAPLAARFGRRRTFITFLCIAAVVVPIYGQMARNPTVLLLLGPVLGFVGHGYWPMFGAVLAELFPTSVRATGQGSTYNIGRGMGALAPYTVGALATIPIVGIGTALAVTSMFYLAGAGLIMFLPDTSNQPLAD
jgi:MFS family permease